jgi:hypothetical protein
MCSYLSDAGLVSCIFLARLFVLGAGLMFFQFCTSCLHSAFAILEKFVIAQQCFEHSARFIKLIMILILEMLLLCILFLVCNYAYTHPQMFSIILEKIISNIPPAEIWDLSEYNFAYLGTII